MAANVKYLSFNKATGTGTQTITGVGFQGTGLILWSTYQGSDGVTNAATMVVGMTDGVLQSTRFIVHPGGESGSGNSTSAQAEQTDHIVWKCDPGAWVSDTPGIVNTMPATVAGVFTGFTSNGFTINWTTNDGGDGIFHCIIFGGKIAAKFKQVKITSSADFGDPSINVTGIGFQPDCLIVMGGAADEFGTGDYSSGSPYGSMHGFGFANGTQNTCGWTLGYTGKNTGSPRLNRGQHTNRVSSVRQANGSGAFELMGAVISSLNPDGFTITRVQGGSGVQPVQHVMCLQGVKFAMGAFNSRTTVGTTTLSLPFQPDVLLMQTLGASASANTSDLGMAIGAWDGDSGNASGGTWIGGENFALAPTKFKRRQYTGNILISAVTTGTGQGNINLAANISSVSETGAIVSFTTAPSTANSIIYLAVADVSKLVGNLVVGYKGNIKGATRAVSFNLRNTKYTDTRDETFTLHGDMILDGKLMMSGQIIGSGGGTVGASSLDDLTDVQIATLASGQYLGYDGVIWKNRTFPTASGGGPVALDDLTDVAIASLVSGQALLYDGVLWRNRTLPVGSGGGSSTLSGLSDVAFASLSSGQYIVYDGAVWRNVSAALGSGAAVLNDLGDVTLATLVSGQFLSYNGTEWRNTSAVPTGLVNNGACQGRLTLESGVPISTSDQTAKTTIYFTPYNGNVIALYDGTSWINYAFSELSLSLGTLTSGKNYDVFAYNNGGTPALELSSAWSSDTARSNALALQDGVLVKSGTPTRRYVGTFYTASTTTTEDSLAKRYVWNNFGNQVARPMRVTKTATWSYTGTTNRQANADTSYQLDLTCGLAGCAIDATLGTTGNVNVVNQQQLTDIGIDSTTVGSATASFNAQAVAVSQFASMQSVLGIGKHKIVWLERVSSGSTGTWYNGSINAIVWG